MEETLDLQSTLSSKVYTSTVVIMPPRSYWPRLQEIRVPNVRELRCGPHITLVYPFLPENLLEEAANLLTPALAQMEAFTITLDTLGKFRNGSSFNLHLRPTVDPPRALHDLQKAIENVFPHCNYVGIKTQGFIPHMSLSSFGGKTAKDLTSQFLQKYELIFKDDPISFQVTEIYICARAGRDPFEVKHAVSLNSAHINPGERPYFGPKTPQISNILFIGNLPRTPDITPESLKLLFPLYTEIVIIKQPDSSSRGCAWIHFETTEQAHNSYKTATKRVLKIGLNEQEIVVKLASLMSYP